MNELDNDSLNQDDFEILDFGEIINNTDVIKQTPIIRDQSNEGIGRYDRVKIEGSQDPDS
jgi:hypothetical protein